MTTTYIGPDPYAAEFARLDKALAEQILRGEEGGFYTRHNRAVALGAQRGYRRAKAEDAELLEAAKAAHVDLSRWQGICPEKWDDEDDVTLIRLTEAISQATGKE